MSTARYMGAPVMLASVLLLGCAASQSELGERIGDETLKQFEAGITSEAWLVAILGQPGSFALVEGIPNTKVFRYALGESSSGMAAIFTGRSTRNTATVYFVITNGVVTRFWADRVIERTITGTPVQDTSGATLEKPKA